VVVQAMTAPDWPSRSACRTADLSLFFPSGDDEKPGARVAREAQAKAVCRTCPVRRPCLELALRAGDASQFGIWGGLNEGERIALRRRRRRLASGQEKAA
jgi:WhiB family redox-sensing transcriptional regulator